MTPASTAATLLAGTLPDMPEWELNKAVRHICDGIAADAAWCNGPGVQKACSALNGHRRFDLTRAIGAAWVGAGRKFNTGIARHYAQALIDLGQLDDADAFLDVAIGMVLATPDRRALAHDHTEFKGQKGRICKQRFVNDDDKGQLIAAFDVYYDIYLENPARNLWQGVNAMALLARAERDGIAASSTTSSAALARLLWMPAVQAPEDGWRLATLAELSLALDQSDAAELWLYRLLFAPACTPFMLESFARQLREVWGARPLDGSGTRIQDKLAAIIARHQMTRLSMLSLTPPVSAEARHALEVNFTGAGSFSVDTIRAILDACAAIGCVCDDKGVRLGTGFLVDAAMLGLPDTGNVFVTNAHVLSETVEGAIAPGRAHVTFEMACAAQGARASHPVSKILYTSPPGPLGRVCEAAHDLDVTVALLDDVPAIAAGLRVSKAIPIVDGQSKAYVIGHPRGSGLQVAVHDSELLDVDEVKRLLHYRTPTDPGSSGSPVFNEDWKLIALHHGGSAKMPRFRPAGSNYQANEGISIHAIRAGILTDLAHRVASDAGADTVAPLR